MSKQLSIIIFFVSTICLLAVCGNAHAATRTASVTGNWNNTTTWGGSSVPVAGDTVTINSGVTVTVTADAACDSIVINAAGTANGITINSGIELTVTTGAGTITMNAASAAVNSTIAVGSGTLSAGSISIAGSGTSSRNTILSVSTGTINVTGDISFSGTAAQAQLTFSGAGTLNIGGDLGAGGTFTKSTGTVNFNGSSAQTFAGYNYNTVKINNAAGVTPAAAPTITTLTIADVNSNSVFSDGGYSITTSTTLNLNSGTYKCYKELYYESDWWNTVNTGTGTFEYCSTSIQQQIKDITYYNLTLSGGGGSYYKYTDTGQTIAINGKLSINSPAQMLCNSTDIHSANKLFFNNAPQSSGTWGSTASSATNKSNTYFVATYLGKVSVASSCTSGTWLGGTSTDWNDAGNWCGDVPSASTNVIIPSGTTYAPHIGSAGGLCNNITINSGATLTMDGSYSLTVSGSWTNNGGTFTASSSTVTFNGASKTIGGSGSTTFNNVSTSGSASISTGIATTIGGSLSIGDGTTFTAAGYNLTVTGTTTVGGGTSGSLVISSATGTKLFTGLVTIASGGTWNNSGNSAVTFRGGITNNGTFTAGSGVHTFNTNSQALTGTLSIPSVTVTGITLTNNNTLTVGTALSGTGGLTQAASSTLNIGGTSGITTLTATASGNTVNYAGTAQSVGHTQFYALGLSGSGNKTFSAATTITGNLDISGSAVAILPNGTTSTANTLTFAGVGQTSGTWGGSSSSAATKNATYFGSTTTGLLSITCSVGTWLGGTSTDWNTAGNWCGGVPTASTDVTISSSTTYAPHIGAAGGSCRNITIDSSATLTMDGAYGLTVSGNWTNNGGTFTASTSTVTFNGASQTIGGSGSTTFKHVTTSGSTNTSTGIATTISGNLTIGDGTTFTAAGYDLTVTGTTTVGGGTSGSLVVSSATGTKVFTGLVTIASGGTWNNSGNSGIELRGGITNSSGTFTAGSGTYTFTTNSQALNGTFSIPSVTVTGVTFTNNNTLTVGTALSGTGGLTQASNATLNIGGTSGISTLTATASSNTVNYTGTAQSIGHTQFNALNLSGSGNKTFTAATTIAGNLDISGSAVAILPNGTTSSANTLTFASTGQAAGTWGGSASSSTNKNATYFGSSTTGVLTVATTPCTAGAWLGTTSTDWNTANNWCGGVPTSSTDVIIPSGTTYAPHIGAAGGLCRNITIDSGATLTMDGSYSLNVSGNWTNNGGTFTPSTSNVTFNGAAQTIGGSSSTTFYDLTLTNAGNKTISRAITISGNIAINSSAVALIANGITATASTITLDTNHDLTSGTWGGSASSAAQKNATYFGSTTTGVVNVTVSMGSPDRYAVATGDWTSTATWSATSGGSSGATMPSAGCNVFIEGGHTVTVNANTSGLTYMEIASGSTLSVSANYTVTSTTIVINGTYRNNSTGAITGTKLVNATGTYQHNLNGGTIPTATWNAGSNCILTGITSTMPTFPAGAAFSNLTINSTNLPAGLNLGSNSFSVTDTFYCTNTGGNTLSLLFTPLNVNNFVIDGGFMIMSGSSTARVLNVSGDFTMSSGALTLPTGSSASADQTLNVTGNVSISGGTLNLSSSTYSSPGDGIMNVGGNFSVNGGTITETGNSTASTITFNGTADQVFSNTGGTVSGSTVFVVNNSGHTVTFSGDNAYTGVTTVTAGTLKLGSAGGATNTPLGTTAAGTSVSSGAALDLNGYSLGTVEALTLNGTGVSSGGALKNSGASCTYAGLITLGSSGVSIVGGTGTIEITHAGTISGSGCNLTLGGAQGGSIASIIGTGAGTLTKQGTGTWTVSGANTYTGATNISAGTLKLGASGGGTNTPLGTTAGTTTVSAGAVLDLNGYTLGTAEGLTLNGTGLTASPAGALTNTGGNASYSGAVTLGSSGATITSTTSGTLAVSGNIGGNTYPLTLDGAGTGTISGIIGTTSGTVTKNGTGTWTLSASNTYTGLTTISAGTLKLGAAGGGTNTPLGTIANGTTVSATGAALDLAGYTLGTSEALTLNGTGVSSTGALVNSASTGTGVTYSGAITLGSASSIGTITLTTGNITLGGGITGGQDLTKVGAGTLNLGSSTATVGALTISAGTLTATSGTMNLTRDFTNDATFTHNSGTVNCNGSSSQALGGSNSSTFNNLTLNNSNGLTLGANETVDGTLTFTSGKITTGAYTLILPTTATVSGADTDKYVYGTVQRAFTSGSPSFTFPIGDASLYDPVALTFTGISTGGDVTASVTDSDCSAIGSSNIIPTKSVNHCWTLANASTVFTSYAATFNYGNGSDVDAGAVPANFIVQNYTGGTWTTLTNSGTPTGTSASVSGVSVFGDFAIGDCKPPSLSVVTSASPHPDAEPGEVITYTVLVTNSGTGPAINVEVTNQLSRHMAWSLNAYGAGVPFSLSQGTPASGLTLGTPVYSNDNGSTWTYTPVSGAGGAPAGYDNNVTNWKIPMSGTMNASGANFSVYFKGRIK